LVRADAVDTVVVGDEQETEVEAGASAVEFGDVVGAAASSLLFLSRLSLLLWECEWCEVVVGSVVVAAAVGLLPVEADVTPQMAPMSARPTTNATRIAMVGLLRMSPFMWSFLLGALSSKQRPVVRVGIRRGCTYSGAPGSHRDCGSGGGVGRRW
jgi:hypothetical protein